ncbi:hypothetical protein H4219_005307 [Mycoemilia scoparia]|uniref:Uncharacterized protein n=1 Tax=Mycoemilia scoparia TaxID=417184 RepID=A0A9W7ZU89_9FUNG|nr:hypothetical protein H4219_005307 [Mycoemilia scoparia]
MYVQQISIWGSSKIVLKHKIVFPPSSPLAQTPTTPTSAKRVQFNTQITNINLPDGEGDSSTTSTQGMSQRFWDRIPVPPSPSESSNRVIEEVDLNNYPEQSLKKLKELFPNANTLNFMLVREPAKLLKYIGEHWPSITNIEMACHINNSAMSSASRLPEMEEIAAKYPSVMRKLKLEYWYSDKDFIASLLQSQHFLSTLSVDTYMNSFDSYMELEQPHTSLTTLNLQYVRWTDEDEVLNISSQTFPSLQKFRMQYLEKSMHLSTRSHVMFSKLFTNVWNNLFLLELPYVTDTVAIQISKSCPQLRSFMTELCYSFTLPDDNIANINDDVWAADDGEDQNIEDDNDNERPIVPTIFMRAQASLRNSNTLGSYILTNKGFIAMMQSLPKLVEFKLGTYSTNSCHLLDHGILLENSQLLQGGVESITIPTIENIMESPDIVSWKCLDIRSIKIRKLWLPVSVYGIMLRMLPHLESTIFEIVNPNVDQLINTWPTHHFLNEIELRFQNEASADFCRQVFNLLPRLKFVYLANYAFDEKILEQEYPNLVIRKKW